MRWKIKENAWLFLGIISGISLTTAIACKSNMKLSNGETNTIKVEEADPPENPTKKSPHEEAEITHYGNNSFNQEQTTPAATLEASATPDVENNTHNTSVESTATPNLNNPTEEPKADSITPIATATITSTATEIPWVKPDGVCNSSKHIYAKIYNIKDLMNTFKLTHANSFDEFKFPADDKLTPERFIKNACYEQFNIPLTGYMSGFPGLDVKKYNTWYAIRFNSKIIIPVSGNYTFKTQSDDGSIFYLNNAANTFTTSNIIIDHDKVIWNSSMPEDAIEIDSKEATINLNAGNYFLRMDYFQGPANHFALKLLWKKPGATSFEVVPASAFIDP